MNQKQRYHDFIKESIKDGVFRKTMEKYWEEIEVFRHAMANKIETTAELYAKAEADRIMALINKDKI